MKIIKLSLVAGLSLAWFSSLNAAGIADIYWYEAKPGKVQEVEALMREGRDIAIASGQTTIVHKQNVGVGGEYRFLWVDFYESYSQKTKASVIRCWKSLYERLQVRSGMLIILFAFASPATFTTVEYRLPISTPFLTPRKGKPAGLADFGRF